MKKPDKSIKHLLYLKRRSAKIERKRKKAKDRIKKQRRQLQGNSKYKQKEIKRFFGYKRVVAPKKFSFIKNTEKTISFINSLEHCLKNKKPVFVNLDNVQEIDYDAITVLLSVMAEFQILGLSFNGSYPLNKDVREKLEGSEFFDRLNKFYINKSDYLIKKKDKIFTKGTKIVLPELGFNVMQEASETIWGEKRICKGLQRVLLELMQNTHNHASASKQGERFWWISVNHNIEEKKVSFVFVDYGQGIFESLSNKPKGNKWSECFQKIKNKVGYSNNAEILRKLLEGELHATVTGQSFRGKGLPGIMEVFKRKQISNLHVISNDVSSNIEKNKYNLLNKRFNGTFLYWELCQNNENKIWNI